RGAPRRRRTRPSWRARRRRRRIGGEEALARLEQLLAVEGHAVPLLAGGEVDVNWPRVAGERVRQSRPGSHRLQQARLAVAQAHDFDRPVRLRRVGVAITLVRTPPDALPPGRRKAVGAVARGRTARAAAPARVDAEAAAAQRGVVGAPVAGAELDRRVDGEDYQLPLGGV